MRLIPLILILLLSAFFCSSQNLKFYVGTYTSEGAEGIYLCNFDSESGDITLNKTFKSIDNPTFLKTSPNKEYLYVVTRSPQQIEKSGGSVSAYKIGKEGLLHFLNKQSSNGAGPCHVDVSSDGKYVAVANYSGGTTALYPVQGDGRLGHATSVIVNKGFGPNKKRQSEPHAHSIKFSPFFEKVFSADLGTDKINIYSLQEDSLVQQGQKYIKLASGAGPRHFDFHPGGEVIYVINELNSTITSLKKKGFSWEKHQSVSTVSPGFKGDNYCADIHVSPNGQFLYGSNRGDNSIAIYAIESTSKRLISLGSVSSEGDWPRNFTLTPDGRFMLVANQKSGNITVFKINKKAGIPEFTGKEIKLPSPVCLEFL